MWFDVQAALAEIEAGAKPATAPAPGANRANRANPATQISTNSTISTPPALELQPDPETPQAPPRSKPEAFPYGQAFGGRPKTWTGRVVSLEEWRGLSAWDKRGPDGRLFCGICRVWIAAGGNACGVAGCPIGGDA